MASFDKLSADGWEDFTSEVYLPLKNEMQGANGFIRRVKIKDETDRKTAIDTLLATFVQTDDFSDLDARINALAAGILSINVRYSTKIYYDYLSYLSDPTLVPSGSTLDKIKSYLSSQQVDKVVAFRLAAIFGRIVNESLSQANKSNAGEAGENLVRAIFSAVGVKRDVHYREQYKSQKGSDTDFVFPNVSDGQDQLVDMFVAVQMSSNDRTRLTASELKVGAKPYVVTGNGLTASKKKLNSIGSQILQSQMERGVHLVCFAPELQREIQRLEKALQSTPAGIKQNEIALRLKYFKEYCWSFSSFAKTVKDKFLR
jgi:hypothetical protein